MAARALVILLVSVALCGCTAGTAPTSTEGKDRPISASTSIDQAHRLALKVTMSGETRVAPGMTPLRIVVLDSRGEPVRDAIVYAEVSSATDQTPSLTLLAASDGTAYHVELPLVYGSRWTIVVKAFSGGRKALLTVSEDLS